mgnify:CR=1 FL=1
MSWAEKILRVNLTAGTVTAEPLNMAWAQSYLGSRGLGSKYLVSEVDPKVDPLSPDNKIIWATGPLTGKPTDAQKTFLTAQMKRLDAASTATIDTGDARALPYPDGSFDVVLSHWVVHNLEPAADRVKALDEMLRVLRPGGVLALADIASIAQYREHLQSRGVVQLRFQDGGFEARMMGVLSGGSYCPQALLAVRP